MHAKVLKPDKGIFSLTLSQSINENTLISLISEQTEGMLNNDFKIWWLIVF